MINDLINDYRQSQSMFPKVAIIILNWNGWKDTIECLESVFRNSYPNYQVVVIDNGSTNGSLEKIKAWADGKQEVLTPELSHPLYYLSHPPVQKPIPYIEYDREIAEAGGIPDKEKLLYNKLPNGVPHPMILIQTGGNLGFAGGNNVGIKYVLAKNDFDYVWLLNNDTVVDKNSLKSLFEKCESNLDLGAAGSKVLYYHKPNVIQAIAGGRLIPLAGIEKRIGNGEEDIGQWDKDIQPDYITGASFLLRKKVINDVGLIDESYFLYWEDTDWSERIKRNRWKLGYSWKSKVWHKEGSSTRNKNSQRDYYGARNGLIFMKRYYQKTFAVGVVISFLGKIFNRARRSDLEGFKAILKAYKEGIIYVRTRR